MRAAPPREGGIVDPHNKRKQPSEIRRLTSQRGAKPSKRSCLRRCLSRPIKTKAPRKPERFQISRSKPQAATLVGSASSTLSELEIGIARGSWLRDLAHEVDVQEPVLQPCALDNCPSNTGEGWK
jgi:hypothetical protein